MKGTPSCLELFSKRSEALMPKKLTLLEDDCWEVAGGWTFMEMRCKVTQPCMNSILAAKERVFIGAEFKDQRLPMCHIEMSHLFPVNSTYSGENLLAHCCHKNAAIFMPTNYHGDSRPSVFSTMWAGQVALVAWNVLSRCGRKSVFIFPNAVGWRRGYCM